MNKTLKLDVISEKMQALGLNPSGLAKKLSVDRQLVSAWLKNDVFPRPDKLLRLGVALGLSFKDIVANTMPESLPVVSFRQKRNRKESEEEIEAAVQKGRLLKHLDERFAQLNPMAPVSLSNPGLGYAYIQTAASTVREQLGVEVGAAVSDEQLIAFFNRLHIVLIPVMWGGKKHYANGLNILIPETKTTYVYLNIDSNVLDLNFWMAHELGHTLASGLDPSSKEIFADAFAEALLFPREEAEKSRNKIRALSTEQAQINAVLTIAKKRKLSPTTVTKAIDRYEQNNRLDHTTFPNGIHGATTNLDKSLGSISGELFKDIKGDPSPAQYIVLSSAKFKTPFFDAMQEYCLKHLDEAVSFIHQVLECPLADSLAILDVFRGNLA